MAENFHELMRLDADLPLAERPRVFRSLSDYLNWSSYTLERVRYWQTRQRRCREALADETASFGPLARHFLKAALEVAVVEELWEQRYCLLMLLRYRVYTRDAVVALLASPRMAALAREGPNGYLRELFKLGPKS